MKVKAFNLFCEEVRTANTVSPVWRFAEYWNDLTGKQAAAVALILESKPEVLKMERDGVRVYQLPTGREWTA